MGFRFNDTLIGDAGINILIGGFGADVLIGGGGNDLLQGGENTDRLLGEAGDDTLTGGLDADIIDGGTGLDTLDYRDSDTGVSISLADKTAVGGHAQGDDFPVLRTYLGRHLPMFLLVMPKPT